MTVFSRARSAVPRVFRNAAYRMSLDHLLYPRRGGRKIIVLYHGIDLEGRTDFNLRFCKLSHFISHLEYYKRNFEVVSLPDIFSHEAPTERDLLAITFDDGYKNNFKYALPALEAHRLHATFFVTAVAQRGQDMLWADAVDVGSRYCDQPLEISGVVFRKAQDGKFFSAETGCRLNAFVKSLPFDEKLSAVREILRHARIDVKRDPSLEDYWALMGEQEIRATASSNYVAIGSHSQGHNNLGGLPLAAAVEEMAESKRYLEKLTASPVDSLAFPDGSYSREVVNAAAEVGYRYLLAVDYQFPEDAADARLMDRLGLYSDRSWTEQLHQVNTRLTQLSSPLRGAQ